MTFLEALYGSQYYEIQQKGRDGNKGRINGNFFLSAIIILVLILIVMTCIRFLPGFTESIDRFASNLFRSSNGKMTGKLLAIPLYFLINFIVAGTIGNEKNFKKNVDAFMQYPDETKKRANAMLLIPFFIVLAIVFGLAIL